VRLVVLGVSAVLVAALAIGGGWYFFLRGDELPPVSLAEAITGASGITTAVPATTSTPAVSSVTATGATTSSSDGGTWTLDAGASFVGYRIDEVLSSVGSTTAVGRTSAVEGALEFDGAAITSVSVTADLRQLSSDDSRRDGQLQRQALETDRFPEATFTLVEPIAIEGDAAAGESIAATAIGDLTLHGVTNRVELALEGQLVDGAVIVVGSTVIALADYDIATPRAMLVLSVADEAIMELQLVFRRA